jgi:quercetin dioxygenase-like cupin family protein
MSHVRFIDDEESDVFVVETFAEAGYELGSHTHEHSHMSLLVSGKAVVTIDGVDTFYDGYNWIHVPANTTHQVKAVTDIIWLCIWADHLAPKQEALDSIKLFEG